MTPLSLPVRGAAPGARWGAAVYTVYAVRSAGWRWRLTRRDGREIAVAPRPVPTVDQARRDVFRVRLMAATAPVETCTDEHGHCRWRLRTPRGAMLAVSAAGHLGTVAVDRAITAFRYAASHGELVD